MFGGTHFEWIFLVLLAVGVAVLFWRQDHDGIQSERDYHRRIRKRARLTDDLFYLRFYAHSGIPAELVLAFRDFHATYWGEDPRLLRPEDDLFAVHCGRDCVDWAAEVRSRFGVEIPENVSSDLRAALPRLDRTFDTVLRYIHRLQGQQGRPNDLLPHG